MLLLLMVILQSVVYMWLNAEYIVYQVRIELAFQLYLAQLDMNANYYPTSMYPMTF